MKAHDPSKNVLKQAIQHFEWALEHLDDYMDELDFDNPSYQEIDNCCYAIRDAYRDLKDFL